jgi:hypothetical protein
MANYHWTLAGMFVYHGESAFCGQSSSLAPKACEQSTKKGKRVVSLLQRFRQPVTKHPRPHIYGGN